MSRRPRTAHRGPGRDPRRDDLGRGGSALRDDPLRRLAKSMMRCGWAMGLMGWEAAVGSAPGSTEARRRRFEDAAHAAERELGESLGAVYRAGVRAGDSMIDGMAELGAGTPLDPRRFARAVADLAERAGETLESMAGRPSRERWREDRDETRDEAWDETRDETRYETRAEAWDAVAEAPPAGTPEPGRWP